MSLQHDFVWERLFIFSMSSTRKFRYTKARLFIFIRNKILKKKKKTDKKTTPKRGGGQNVGSEGCQDQDRIFHGIFFLFLHTTRFCMCMCIYIIVSKRIVIEGGMGSSPRIIFSNFHTKWCHFRQF